MQFHPMPELTTGLTDLAMGLLALSFFLLLCKRGLRSLPGRLWRGATASVALAGFLGATVHCFVLPRTLNWCLWLPIYVCLGLVLAFLAGAAHFSLRPDARRWPFWLLTALLIALAAVFMLFLPRRLAWDLVAAMGAFVIIFLVYCYIRLYRQDKAYAYFLFGLCLLLPCALPWAVSYFTFSFGGLLFDGDSLCHFGIMLAFCCFYPGICRTLLR